MESTTENPAQTTRRAASGKRPAPLTMARITAAEDAVRVKLTTELADLTWGPAVETICKLFAKRLNKELEGKE